MDEDSHALLRVLQEALGGDPRAQRRLVDRWLPIVQGRVARTLLRRRSAARARDIRQEVADFTQEVFARLFADRWKALRRWDPDRGLSLDGFVGRRAEHRVIEILRTKSQNPWTEEPMLPEHLDVQRDAGPGPESGAMSREVLERVAERLDGALTDQGHEMFCLLLIEERSTEEIEELTGMKPAAIYKWRSRLAEVARKVAGEIVSESGASRRKATGS